MAMQRGNNFGWNISNMNHGINRITIDSRDTQKGLAFGTFVVIVLFQNTYFYISMLCLSLYSGQCVGLRGSDHCFLSTHRSSSSCEVLPTGQ